MTEIDVQHSPVVIEVTEQVIVIEVIESGQTVETVDVSTPTVIEVRVPGSQGESAYAAAVAGGFVGTEAAWLLSLQGDDGLSAYQVAVANGFVGTEAQWLLTLQGYSRRYDESGNYQYAGAAPNGSAEGAAVWTIRRLTYASSAYVTTQQALNVTWTGRAGHTYT